MDLYPAASTQKRKLVTRKEQSSCSNREPCTVGSIAWSFNHILPSQAAASAGCCLDFIARELSIVEGLDMMQHSASKLPRILPRPMFGSRRALPLLQHVQSLNRIIVLMAAVSLERSHHLPVAPARAITDRYFPWRQLLVLRKLGY